MRYLAIDLGDRRTGIAVGDDESGLVSPVAVLVHPPGPALDRALDRLLDEHGPDVLIVGLPLNMDGTAGPRAARVRAFGDATAARTSLPVRYQDERLTTYAADGEMAGSGLTRKRKKELRDALAAAVILRDHLGRSTDAGDD